MVPLLELIVQFLKTPPSEEPKNREPEGAVKGETVDVMSEDCISPNTATSRAGNDDNDWKRDEDMSGGTGTLFVVSKTNLTRAVATLMSGMEERYCKIT